MKTPYPYQKEAVQKIANAPGYILADACGLGKTLTAIEAAKQARMDNPKWRALVICPPHLVPQWLDEITEQDPLTSRMPADARPYRYSEILGWVVTTYYELQRDYFLTALCEVLWDFVVIDEAHRIKNKRTGFAKNVKKIPTARALALTATPLDERTEDIWSLLNFVNPDEFPAYYGFVARWLETEDDYWRGKVIVGPKDPKKFSALLANYMIRRAKEDVLPDLPPRIDVPVRVPMDIKQAEAYDEIKNSEDILVKVQDQELVIPNTLALITKLQQIATWPPLVGVQLPSAKITWLTGFIRDHDEPIVVFSRFRDVALCLARRMIGDYIVGGERSPDFDEKKFMRLFGTIDAMGEGLNLQRADIAIFLDGHWSTLRMTHALDRIHRMDIKVPKTIYMLHSCREDRMVYEAVKRKWNEADLVYKYLGGRYDTIE